MKPDTHGFASRPRAALALSSCRLCLAFGLVAMVLLGTGVPGRSALAARVDEAVRAQVSQSGSARVIVTMREAALRAASTGNRESRRATIKRLAARVISAAPAMRLHHRYIELPFLAGEVDAKTLDKLAQLPEVEQISPDRPVHALLNTSGPLVGQPQAEAAGFAGQGVGIAIIDTGVDYTHPALGGGKTKVFTDTKPGFWAWRQIQAAVENGVVQGYDTGDYKPTAGVTRDQMAVYIARALVSPTGDAAVPAGPATATFSDVPNTGYGPNQEDPYWAYKYIEYCVDQGVVQGYDSTHYDPTGAVTRDQMAVFIARARGWVHIGDDMTTAPELFPDVPAGHWAGTAIKACIDHGVVQGYENGTYGPTVPVTRDQMAVFVQRGFALQWTGRVIGGANLMSVSGIDPTDPMDDNGHGTNVAGMAASGDTTYRGIAPKASIIPLKVLDANGQGMDSDIIEGIDWCIQNQQKLNIRVINMSLGGDQIFTSHEEADAEPTSQAVTAAVDAGITVVTAAGNGSAASGLSIPAAASAAISVGATTDGGAEPESQPADSIAYYSNRGELLTLYAPGTVITAPNLGGGFASGDGTSFASPHVAGAAAVLASKGITDPRQIRSLLAQTGVQIIDPTTGVATPRLDLTRAINPPTDGPDLVVTSISTDTTSPTTGDTIPISVTVKNQGNAASEAVNLDIVISANSVASPQDASIAEVAVPALSPGQSYSPTGVEGTVKVMLAGDYFLGAYVDSDYVVAETDETNNGLAGTPLTVKLAAARVVSSTIPATMQAGHSYPVSVTMQNEGDVTWTATDYALVPARPEDAGLWGISQVALPVTVVPGAQYTFNFNVTAPSTPGPTPCYWQMAKGGERFGEVATGATKAIVLDSPAYAQVAPTISSTWAGFEDYRYDTRAIITLKRRSDGLQFTIPDSIHPSGGWPSPTFDYFTDPYTNHWMPALSGDWIAWSTDDVPLDPGVYDGFWVFQIAAYDLAAPGSLPLRVTYQHADAIYPDMDGTRIVWEDYRNDPDRMFGSPNFIDENPDVYIADVTDIDPGTGRPREYALCTAPGPQFSPRISGNLVVWEDWRDLTQGDIYCYDLSVDSDGDGIPNWKDLDDRPSPDPAEKRLTATDWSEQYPDVSGRNVVWMDLRDYTNGTWGVDIYGTNVDTLAEIPIATTPATFRQQPRISGTQVTWEDWRTGLGSVYWHDLATGVEIPLAGGSIDAGTPDLAGTSLTYVEDRGTTDTYGNEIYNAWKQALQPYVNVTP